MNGVDFTTYGGIQYVSAAQAQAMVTQGYECALIGYDTSPQSMLVRQALTTAGMHWMGYRLPDRTRANDTLQEQVADLLTAIGDAVAAGDAPLAAVLDIEPQYDAAGNVIPGSWPTQAELTAMREQVEAAFYVANGSVKKAIYTGAWVWNAYYPGFTEFAENGWLLIDANWNKQADLNITPYGGWTAAQICGHQYQAGVGTPIGLVDLDYFADWLVQGSAQALLQQAIKLLQQVGTMIQG